MNFTVRDVADWVQGEVVGDPGRLIRAAKPLSDSPGIEDITVVLDEKYLSQFHASNAGAAVVELSVPLNGKTLVRVKDPLMAFVTIIQRMHVKPAPMWMGIHPTAVVHPTAEIGPDASVGPHVTIGEGTVIGARCKLLPGVTIGHHCQLGDDVSFGPHVAIYDGCVLGHRVIIHANSVIGGDGFGFRMVNGRHTKVPQVGNVEIGDDVEIGACSTIDRATFGTTRIGSGTKLDNHVQIAHNCQIGKHNVFAALVGIAGSVTTGDYVMMGGQVGVADHSRIGDRTMLGAKSGVHGDVPADQKLLGSPPIPIEEELRVMVCRRKLPEMWKDIREIKKKLKASES